MEKKKKLGMAVHACHPRYSGNHKLGGSQYRAAWAKSETLSQKSPEKRA
jgi:hypothetical protein